MVTVLHLHRALQGLTCVRGPDVDPPRGLLQEEPVGLGPIDVGVIALQDLPDAREVSPTCFVCNGALSCGLRLLRFES